MIAQGASVIGRPPFTFRPAGAEQCAPWMVVGADGRNALVCRDGVRLIFTTLYDATAVCAEATFASQRTTRR